MALGPQCLALVLLVTLLPAGLAFSVLRAPNSRVTDPREILLSRRNQLGPPLGPWEICALVTCSHAAGGATKDACMLQCVNDARSKSQKTKEPEKDESRRQMDSLQSCIEAKCAGADMHCIYEMCVSDYKWGSKTMKTRMLDAFDSAKPKRLGGTYGMEDDEKRGGTYGDAKRSQEYRSKGSAAKRSWDDPTAACIEYNCSQHQPSSVEYHLCFSAMCRHR